MTKKKHPTRQDITVRNLRAIKKLWNKHLKDLNKKFVTLDKKLAVIEKRINGILSAS